MDRKFKNFLLKSIQEKAPENPSLNSYSLTKLNINFQDILHYGFPDLFLFYFENDSLCRNINLASDVKDYFTAHYLKNSARNIKIIQTVKKLAGIFKAAGIKLVFLKGSAYLSTIYKSEPGVRLMGDIDVLVEEADLERAKEILKKENFIRDYERFSKQSGIEVPEEAFYNGFHYVFFKEDIQLELHWRVSRSCPRAAIERIFDSLENTSIEEESIYIPSPAASLFITCNNFLRTYLNIIFADCISKSRTNFRIYDILFFLYEFKKLFVYYKDNISWDDFFFLCDECKDRREVITLLLYACKFTQCKLPKEALIHKDKSKIIKAYLFFLGLYRNDFMRAFILRNVILAASERSLFRKNPKAFLFKVFYLTACYMSFDNKFMLIICKSMLQAVESVKSLWNFLRFSTFASKFRA